MKKITLICYAFTFIILISILAWGLLGAFGVSGPVYRLFSFYAIIPMVLFVCGGVLGLKNAPLKWVYPILFWGLSRGLMHIVVGWPIPRRLSFVSPFLPLIFASAGVILGTAIGVLYQRAHPSLQKKLGQIGKGLLITTVAIGLIHIGHALTLDRIIQYKEVEFASPKITEDIHGFRVAFVVDTHNLAPASLQAVVEELNTRDINALILGGDFPRGGAEPYRSMEILAQTITTHGIFGVEGNHDHYPSLFAAKEAQGIMPLSNSGLHIGENFFFAGVEDLWNRNPNISQAIQGANPQDFVLLISHNPDVAMGQDTTGVDLILSGHTHGGQMRVFGLWAPYFTVRSNITAYGQRFVSGWAEDNQGTPVFVSNGTGEYLPRVFARPQVVLMTLVQK